MHGKRKVPSACAASRIFWPIDFLEFFRIVLVGKRKIELLIGPAIAIHRGFLQGNLAGLVSFQHAVDNEARETIGHGFQGILIPCEFWVVDQLVYFVAVPVDEFDQ